MSHTPFFSVVVPTYNRAWALPQTIQHIQAQTYTDFEVLVVDDGSTDETDAMLAEIVKTDSRVRVFKQNNSGACAARQHGWNNASGEWVVYVDSDDHIYPQFLHGIADSIHENTGTVFGVTNHRRRKVLFDSQTHTQLHATDWVEAHASRPTLQEVLSRTVHTSSTGLFHKRVLEPQIQWDSQIRRFQDWDLLLQFAAVYPHGFCTVSEVLFDYSESYGWDSMCGSASYADWADAYEAIYRKHAGNAFVRNADWYPEKVNKYRKRQKQYEAGEMPSNTERIFHEYFTAAQSQK